MSREYPTDFNLMDYIDTTFYPPLKRTKITIKKYKLEEIIYDN